MTDTQPHDVCCYTFDRFEIEMTLEQALSASHTGECSEDVAALVACPAIASQLDKIGPDKIRDELGEYGAWDEEELAFDDSNRHRIVWLAAGNIREEHREVIDESIAARHHRKVVAA